MRSIGAAQHMLLPGLLCVLSTAAFAAKDHCELNRAVGTGPDGAVACSAHDANDTAYDSSERDAVARYAKAYWASSQVNQALEACRALDSGMAKCVRTAICGGADTGMAYYCHRDDLGDLGHRECFSQSERASAHCLNAAGGGDLKALVLSWPAVVQDRVGPEEGYDVGHEIARDIAGGGKAKAGSAKYNEALVLAALAGEDFSKDKPIAALACDRLNLAVAQKRGPGLAGDRAYHDAMSVLGCVDGSARKPGRPPQPAAGSIIDHRKFDKAQDLLKQNPF